MRIHSQITVAFTLVLFGCMPPAAPGTSKDAASTPLVDTEWRLVELNGAPSIRAKGEQQPHVRFLAEDNRLEGYSGCNSFSGSYELSGSQLRATGPMMMTKRACVQSDLNAQEGKFVAALGAMTRYSISGRTLTISSAAGTVAKFEAAG